MNLSSLPAADRDTPTLQITTPPATDTAHPPPSKTPAPTEKGTSTPTKSASPTVLACWDEGGTIEEGQIRTEILPLPLRYRIYLPPCYHQQPDRRYPVLYLLHGQTYTEAQWDRLGIDETANAMIARGDMPPIIIVMPREDGDYTPPPENPFGKAVTEALVPHLDKNIRTLDHRQYRAIGGISRGGNWALHLGLTRFETFSAIGGHSTPTFVTEGPSQVRELLQDIPSDQVPRIYLDAGENDRWISSTLKLEALLTEEGISHEWHQFPGYHEEEYWAAHLEDYLTWYVQEW